jgi:hypothetical protein
MKHREREVQKERGTEGEGKMTREEMIVKERQVSCGLFPHVDSSIVF